MKNYKKLSGFTLVELLIVIAILAVLTSVLMVNFEQARKKTRDARRISDLKSIQNGLEQYRVVAGAYPAGTYPPSGTFTNGQAVTEYFPNGWPTDPRTSTATTYEYIKSTWSAAAYQICTDLEANGTSWTGLISDQCVGNLQ